MTVEDVSRAQRVIGAVAVGAAAVTWWPAFTLGAWGTVPFEQLPALWVVATAALLVVLVHGRPQGIPRIAAASLIIPSIWILLALLPVPEGSAAADATAWSGIVVTVIGIPYLIWVLLREANPSTAQLVSARQWAAAAMAEALVALLGFALGTQESRFLSWEDLMIRGSSQPPCCTSGDGTLVRP